MSEPTKNLSPADIQKFIDPFPPKHTVRFANSNKDANASAKPSEVQISEDSAESKHGKSHEGLVSGENSGDGKRKPIEVPELGEAAREEVHGNKEASPQIFKHSSRVEKWIKHVPDAGVKEKQRKANDDQGSVVSTTEKSGDQWPSLGCTKYPENHW